METSACDRLLGELLAERRRFVAFLTARLNNEADAEDVLQNALVRALGHAEELRDGTKWTAWFFGILRNAVIDHQRSRGMARRRETLWSEDRAMNDRELERRLCRCLETVVTALPERAAELVRRVDLGGEPVRRVAEALGLSENHAGVALHRARKELRRRLVVWCGDCSGRTCLDCDCGEMD